MRIIKRIAQWRRRKQWAADLAEEIRIHREMAEEWEPGRSRDFGSVALTLEDSRAAWRYAWIESLAQDIRYALRSFRKSPGFALAVVGTIGAALGLNTSVFTVINAYALRPLAVNDPYSLYGFQWVTNGRAGHAFSTAEFRSLRELKAPFSEVLAYRNFLAPVEGRQMLGQPVSENYFSMLGAGMFQGRPLEAGDTDAMVLSYDAWRNKFAADPGMVGRKVYMRGHPFLVVGITAPGFVGIESMPAGCYIPLAMRASVTDLGDDIWVIGRLLPGVRVEAARDALLSWSQAQTVALPERERAASVMLTPRATSIPLTTEVLAMFLPLVVAFGLVLLTACANVSNMMLARALARQREIGIRISLGAGRARLVRQLLTESAMLALPSAALGIAIAQITVNGTTRLLFVTAPPAYARILSVMDLSPDWRVFAFILAGAVAATLVFGLIPALQTTRSELAQANRGDFANDLRPQRLRNFLVAAQVAVCALLLIATVIVVRTGQRVMVADTGLAVHDVYDVRMVSKFQAAAAERLAREPGVEVVAAAFRAPLYGSPRRMMVTPSGSAEAAPVGKNFVSPQYFAVFRIPLVRGRLFTDREAASDAPVVVVSESAARRLWPHSDAVGEHFAISLRRVADSIYDRAPHYASAQVIGVVRDTQVGMIANGPDTSYIYFPTTARAPFNDSVLVRMSGGPASVRRRLEAALNDVAPSVADAINPMDDVLELQFYPFRIVYWVAGFLGCFSLALTVSGIYGVMSYLVNQRTKEIGIRVALGARASDVIGMVMRQSVRLAAIGGAVGVGAMLSVAPLLANQIGLLNPYDWMAYLGGAGVVVAATIAASWQPVRRAAGVDPAVVLKCD
jgi:predicted permease